MGWEFHSGVYGGGGYSDKIEVDESAGVQAGVDRGVNRGGGCQKKKTHIFRLNDIMFLPYNIIYLITTLIWLIEYVQKLILFQKNDKRQIQDSRYPQTKTR